MGQNTEINELITTIADEQNTDIILYNGGIFRPCDERLITECLTRGADGRRKNVMLILVTGGGDPDAAYRIARCLQNNYQTVSLYVSGICKSAGTLIAVGAHQLIFSEHGELGPLDMQMAKQDEFFASQSGLTISTALEALENRAFRAVERMFIEIENNTGGMLSVHTATDLASKTVVGLYGPIAEQIDPMHLGEAARALLIADAYGQRLNESSRNLAGNGALNDLYTSYPSHGFVIDRQEATKLFKNVREPNGNEARLIEALGPMARKISSHALGGDPHRVVNFLTAVKVSETESSISVRHDEAANDENGANNGAEEQQGSSNATGADAPTVSGDEAAARKPPRK
jgi:Serine dehydrogenase proteinase